MVSSFDSRINVSQERQDPGVWNTKIAAEMYGKSERTIRRLLKDGVIEGYKIEGPCGPEWRIKPDASVIGAIKHESAVGMFAKIDNDKEIIAQLEIRIAELERSLQLQGQHFRVQRLHLVANQPAPIVARSPIASTVSQFWQSMRSTVGAIFNACRLAPSK
ncbi:hypothetical protein BH10CYA1_BH10CYA1_17680 [soil metagenome]